jgi:cysteinyl-tRNA synthetase, unknown class
MHIKSLTSILFLILLFNLGCKKDSDPVEVNSSSLKDVRFWAYQIDSLEEPASIDSICSSHYDLVVMDQQRSISGSEDYNTQNDIQRIHNSLNSKGGKKLVVCYIDVGQAESYRYYWQNGWQSGNPAWVLEPDPDGWNDSYGVKYWSPEWKALMKQYLGRIIDDGYDGVYLDWLMIYETPGILAAAQQEGLDPKEELILFIKDLTSFSRNKKPGFLFIAQNGAEMGDYPEYVALFDAIAQEDIWYDGSGDPDNGGSQGDWQVDPLDSQYYIEELNKWQQQDKPVFNVEYAQLPDHVTRAYELGSQHSFVTYTTLRLLDKLTGTPPPGY